NANVFYELGIRHALRKRRTILIKGVQAADAIPFDALTDRYLPYDLDEPSRDHSKLVEMIEATLRSDRDTDSPVFKMLPALPEAREAGAPRCVRSSDRAGLIHHHRHTRTARGSVDTQGSE